MNPDDLLIRSLYELSQAADWQDYRARALERVARALGAHAVAWLTQVRDRQGPAEFTVYPANTPLTAQQLLELPLDAATELAIKPAHGLTAIRKGSAIAYAHLGSSLVSQVVYGFENGSQLPVGDTLLRVTGHMAEAGALALRQYILLDERLSSLGRSNRGSAALVDIGGTIHASSASFRELLSAEYRKPDPDRLPFVLPPAAFQEQGLFSQGALRFRAVRAGAVLFLLHARKVRPLDQLSPREREIARALSAGKTFKTVAKDCDIAISTVANHASRIYRKLGIYRREELIEILHAPGRAAA